MFAITCTVLHCPARGKIGFLHQESGDRTAALTVLSTGIKGNPHSGRLLLLQGELSLLEGNTAQALESFRHARDKQADQAQTESGIAIALHLNGAPIGECVAAYRVAITLNPKNANLRLNLAQLLFIKSDDREASRQLQEALRLGLDDSASARNSRSGAIDGRPVDAYSFRNRRESCPQRFVGHAADGT